MSKGYNNWMRTRQRTKATAGGLGRGSRLRLEVKAEDGGYGWRSRLRMWRVSLRIEDMQEGW